MLPKRHTIDQGTSKNPFKRVKQHPGKRQLSSINNGQHEHPFMPTTYLPPELWIDITKLLSIKDNIALQRVDQRIGLCARHAYNYHLGAAKTLMANADADHLYRLWRTFIVEDNAYGLLALAEHHHTNKVVIDNFDVVYNAVLLQAHPQIHSLLIALYGRAYDIEGMTMLHNTVMRGHFTMMIALVCKYDIPVDIADNHIDTIEYEYTDYPKNSAGVTEYCHGYTPLYYAAKYDKLVAARCLLDLGANANTRCMDMKGYTPLHVAVEVGSVHMVQLLLEYQVNPNVTDNCKRTPLHIAAESGQVILVRLLLKHNANINVLCEQSYTPLHLAVNYRHHAIVKVLMESKAICSTHSITQQTPLHDAIASEDIVSIHYLLKYNASVNIQNGNGSTALHAALSKLSNCMWFQIAMNNHADLTIQNGFGKTPLDCARQTIQECQDKKQQKVLKLMLEAVLFQQYY